MTLKESQEGGWAGLGDLKKGDVVKGKIKRLEPFGVFVELHNSSLTGLAHISEVSDEFVKNLQDSFQIGQGKFARSRNGSKFEPKQRRSRFVLRQLGLGESKHMAWMEGTLHPSLVKACSADFHLVDRSCIYRELADCTSSGV